MELLERISEREFLFVTSEARNKFRSILKSIEVKKSVALAYNGSEPKEYRKSVNLLYKDIYIVKQSLVSDASYKRPIIYTGISEKLSVVINSIVFNQPESIFKLLNQFLVIRMELEKLIVSLRN